MPVLPGSVIDAWSLLAATAVLLLDPPHDHTQVNPGVTGGQLSVAT